MTEPEINEELIAAHGLSPDEYGEIVRLFNREPSYTELGIFSEIHGRQELRAIGRYYLDADGRKAEVAFVVHEAHRHHGMAGFLLGELADVAKRRKVAGFWASVLPENRAMAVQLPR